MPLPEQYGPYSLVSYLGRGSIAEVFKASISLEGGLSRLVVVKRILRGYMSEPRFVELFINEARIASQLSHPNIVHIYDTGRIEGLFYIAMEYLRGRDLLWLLRDLAGRPFPPLIAGYIMREVARGLGYAHERVDDDEHPRPVVHRDVSPPNIMLCTDGQVKLLDFGIAKAVDPRQGGTRTGVLKGKLAYMAPEQLTLGTATPQSDIFSLGAVFYELLTGRALFAGATEFDTMTRVVSAPIEPPSEKNFAVSAAMDMIVMRALEREPTLRYRRAAEMARDLDVILQAACFTVDAVAEWLRPLALLRRGEPTFEPAAEAGGGGQAPISFLKSVAAPRYGESVARPSQDLPLPVLGARGAKEPERRPRSAPDAGFDSQPTVDYGHETTVDFPVGSTSSEPISEAALAAALEPAHSVVVEGPVENTSSDTISDPYAHLRLVALDLGNGANGARPPTAPPPRSERARGAPPVSSPGRARPGNFDLDEGDDFDRGFDPDRDFLTTPRKAGPALPPPLRDGDLGWTPGRDTDRAVPAHLDGDRAADLDGDRQAPRVAGAAEVADSAAASAPRIALSPLLTAEPGGLHAGAEALGDADAEPPPRSGRERAVALLARLRGVGRGWQIALVLVPLVLIILVLALRARRAPRGDEASGRALAAAGAEGPAEPPLRPVTTARALPHAAHPPAIAPDPVAFEPGKGTSRDAPPLRGATTLRVRVDSAPRGAAVYAGPKRLGQAPISIELTAATPAVLVTLSMPGRREVQYQVRRTDAPSVTVALPPGGPGAPPAGAGVTPPPDPPADPEGAADAPETAAPKQQPTAAPERPRTTRPATPARPAAAGAGRPSAPPTPSPATSSPATPTAPPAASPAPPAAAPPAAPGASEDAEP